MSKSVGNVATIQDVIARVGPRGGAALPDDGALAQAARVLAGGDDGRRRAGREPAQRAPWRDTGDGDWDELAAVLDDDFNTPAALAIFHRWAREGALDELRRGLAVFGLGTLGDAVEAPAAIVALARARGPKRVRRATSPSRIACVTRSRRPGWEVRDVGAPEGSSSCRCS